MIEIQRAETTSGYDAYNLSIDGHTILSNWNGDLDWILEMEKAIKNLFPHLINNLSAQEIQKHQDCTVLQAFVKHQEQYFKRYILGDFSVKNSFDYNYNPSHYFNYNIPQEDVSQEAIAS